MKVRSLFVIDYPWFTFHIFTDLYLIVMRRSINCTSWWSSGWRQGDTLTQYDYHHVSLCLHFGTVLPFVSLHQGSWVNTPSRLSHVRFKPSAVSRLDDLAKHQSTLILVLQWCRLCRCGSPRPVCTDIVSCIPSSERAVGDRERMLDLLQRWGQHRAEVRFFLRHNRAPRESGKLPSSILSCFSCCTQKGFSLSQKAPFTDSMHWSSSRDACTRYDSISGFHRETWSSL